MRVNVYTEELLTTMTVTRREGEPVSPITAEVVTAEYISSRTGQTMKNYGLRIFLKSAPELHYIPGRDDDRSAITFWCGSDKRSVSQFWELIKFCIEQQNIVQWHDKLAGD